ncbi:MAG: hypothetical protein GY953_51215 [bacterium]|nr:hypothetical protein [bacterium]
MADLLSLPANAMPDKPALIYRGSEITFHELRRLVFQFVNALAALGVGKGERECRRDPAASYIDEQGQWHELAYLQMDAAG